MQVRARKRRDDRVQGAEDSQTSPRRAALIAALRHSAVLILVLTAMGAVLGTAAGLQRADRRTAEASILVSPLEGNPFSPTGSGDDLVNLETEAQLVGSETVARDVATRLGESDTTSEILSGLQVAVPANTQILTITYTAGSDAVAVRRAQGFADAYLDFRKARSEQIVRARTERIQSQINDQNEQLASLLAKSTIEKNPARKDLLQEQIRGVTAQISQLRAQLAELQTGTVDPGQVITPASAKGGQSVTGTIAYGLLGAALGLAVALLIVVVRARAENRLHDAEDVAPSGLPLLGTISTSEVEATHSGMASPAKRDTLDIGPGLQSLRVAILSRERRRPVRILYAAAEAGSATPRTALGLAYAAAASGLTTVLVDATGDGGEITRLLDLRSGPGFAEVLAGDAALDAAMTKVTDHLLVVPAGATHARSDDLLSGPALGSMFEHLDTISDIVIIATGPMGTARSRALAMITDSTVIEAVEGQSRLGDLVAVTDDPTLAESLLGVVFVARARGRSRKTAGA
jgi:capsular polysaccharide biosynthesis protein